MEMKKFEFCTQVQEFLQFDYVGAPWAGALPAARRADLDPERRACV